MRLLAVMFLLAAGLAAQEQDSLDWDINTIFNEPPEEAPAGETLQEPRPSTAEVPVSRMLQRRGFVFDASFRFNVGVAPGWRELPWDQKWDDKNYYLDRYIRMRNSFSIDAQISESFRVLSTVFFEIPGFRIQLGDFFFDYRLYDTVFFRGGKYNHSWGISPNYGFSNLLSRVPAEGYALDPFIFKADVPIGKGGIQLLTLTRFDLMGSSANLPKWEDFGVGGKYNLALPWADLDAGIFYQDGMALRGFLSVKTTLWDTELYNEWLGAIDVHEPSNVSGAFNVGFEREFFSGKFSVNGELFYNAEKDTYWYEPETNIREARTSLFVEGFNMAVNLSYRPWDRFDLRLFFRTLYAPMEHSAQVVPGLRLRPWPNVELSLAVPMGLGRSDGYYHKNTVTVTSQNEPLPFAVIFMVTLNGGVRFRHSY